VIIQKLTKRKQLLISRLISSQGNGSDTF